MSTDKRSVILKNKQHTGQKTGQEVPSSGVTDADEPGGKQAQLIQGLTSQKGVCKPVQIFVRIALGMILEQGEADEVGAW